MRTFVTGATGVLGHRVVDGLTDRDHEVYGLVRDETGADRVAELGGIPRRGDVLDRTALADAIPDVDAVVHAATALPTATRPSDDAWTRNDRVRRDGMENVLSVAGDDVEYVLFPSVVWVARRPDGSAFDETASRNPDRTTRSAAAVETLLADAATKQGFTPAVLRFGFFYAPDAAHTRQFGRNLLSGRFPVVGRGVLGRRDGTLSFVHAADAARAVAAAVEAELGGLYHVVDDRPVPFAAFASTFAERLGARPPRRVPAWLARWVLGRETVALLTRPMPTTNERFRATTAWEPRYPTHEAGLAQVVEAWASDGTLRETAGGYEWAAN